MLDSPPAQRASSHASETGPAAAPEAAVHIRGLNKTYRAAGKSPAKRALIDVDLDVPRGCLFGLLGPNGAKLPRLPGLTAYWFAWSGHVGQRAALYALDAVPTD